MSLERIRNVLWPLLVPLSFLWAAATWLRRRVHRRARARPPLPTVCFGNVHDGGTGKTPLVLACVRRFAERKPVVVSRGYGGTATGSVSVVDLSGPEPAARFGDEPVLLASLGAKVVVGRDRAAAIAYAASEHGAGWVVLDDGFQRLGVPKSFSVVVVPANRSPWEAWCWPAGPLREPLSAIRHADAVVLTVWPDETAGLTAWDAVLADVCGTVPRYRAMGRVEAVVDPSNGRRLEWKGPVAALCGIGAPERFFRRVRERGTVLCERAFPDHHRFRSAELEAFGRAARSAGATAVVTTAKDWPRLAPVARVLALPVYLLEIGYEVPESLWQDLESRLHPVR